MSERQEPTVDERRSKLCQSGDLQYTKEGTVDEGCPGNVHWCAIY